VALLVCQGAEGVGEGFRAQSLLPVVHFGRPGTLKCRRSAKYAGGVCTTGGFATSTMEGGIEPAFAPFSWRDPKGDLHAPPEP
jgi:hypothetical protein